ncbi:MAG: arginase family protein [Candidatus Thorarchaeota archaeon]
MVHVPLMPLRDVLNGYLRAPRDFFGIPPPSEGDPTVGVLGIPYDLTSSYSPGARWGPDAIRRATDSERSTSYPLSLGSDKRHMEPLSKQMTLEDIGDLEVMLRLPESAAVDIAEAAALLAKSESSLLFLGGDHFITYPLMRGLSRGRPGTYGLVYLDAHADYYEDMGGYQFSHASTVRRIVEENLVKLEHVAAFDIRSAVPDQRTSFQGGSDAEPVSVRSFKDTVKSLADSVDMLYVSLDLDVFDPALVPGVAHPESGGPSFADVVSCLDAAFETGKVRYADIVEFNPLLDPTATTSITARDILKEMLFGFSNPQAF